MTGTSEAPGLRRSVGRLLPWIAGMLLLGGCGRLDSIPYEPVQTPQSWLARQPYLTLRIAPAEAILVQPTSTVLVYSLGLLAIGVGLYLRRSRDGHRSRAWWSLALLLWGLGALSAGTSYQAFSYEIKCAGRAVCAWTSWWEVAYLLLSAASVDAMVVAGAYSCTVGRGRRILLAYAFANAGLYAVAVSVGALVPIPFLISFELLVLVAAPSILILLMLNGRRYRRLRDAMDRALLGIWLGLILVLGAYFLYLVLDITPGLWARGIWFSENDVLHLGLIMWMVYIGRVVAKWVVDVPQPGVVA